MKQPILAALRTLVLIGVLLIGAPSTATAAVQITFYSHEFGSNFPHAFVLLSGTDDRNGERIEVNYGFTATHLSPAILLGPVKGEIFSRDSAKDVQYLRASNPHFSFTLSDLEYDTVLATVQKWRDLKQPSYNLNHQNCVHFVADVAARLGMKADTPKALMKKPRSYTEFLTRSNQGWLLARNAVLYRGQSSAARSPAPN